MDRSQHHRVNIDYIEERYLSWKADSNSVSEEWQYFFSGFDFANQQHLGNTTLDFAHKQSNVDRLIYAFLDTGYLAADLDPLGRRLDHYRRIELEDYGLTRDDLHTVFSCGHYTQFEEATLQDLINSLDKTYCGTVGVEYVHIQDQEVRRWLQKRIEQNNNKPNFSAEKKRQILSKLIEAETFERFLHSHFVGQKRFSLEGGESLIPGLHALVEKAPSLGFEEIVFGTAHRGRLTILTSILEMSVLEIFTEFEDNYIPEAFGGDGDVKYHIGFSHDYKTTSGKSMHLSLVSNPSHLEVVGPVVLGKARAKQRRKNDTIDRNKVLPLIIHGDSAFSGQGVVPEMINLSNLNGYRTGGAFHIIINNQIGFTTAPHDSRSSNFPTDVMKIVGAPIFHVNGDDPESLVHVIEMALEFRQTFHRDVMVDLFCYRRHGHNEGDDPSFTQPRMYDIIKKHPTPKTIYADRLIKEGVIDAKDHKEMEVKCREPLKDAFNNVKNTPPKPTFTHHHSGAWTDIKLEYSYKRVATKVSRKELDDVSNVLTTIPETLHINTKLKRIIDDRKKRYSDGGPIEWAFGEALAFGTLLNEKIPIRLSGQDSRRGTFSQRHSSLWDIHTNEDYVPLNNISHSQAKYCAYDSPLSEVAVMGFDYGYAMAEPHMLVMWEAQFGDFVNGAQVIVDQFIAAAESKWRRSCGLVLLLPHGYEGQGPEHSNAHIERFLQLCAEDNIQVCNLTTPAQYFHLLRLQVKRDFRKPLVVFTPKSLLRHPKAVSRINDFTNGCFSPVLDDNKKTNKVIRLLFCSGKIYYDLLAEQEKQNIETIALIRTEQYYPFPESALKKVLDHYQNVTEYVWVQEEPENRGAWSFMEDHFQSHFNINLDYVGRHRSASPATGSLKQHKLVQQNLVEKAFSEDLNE